MKANKHYICYALCSLVWQIEFFFTSVYNGFWISVAFSYFTHFTLLNHMTMRRMQHLKLFSQFSKKKKNSWQVINWCQYLSVFFRMKWCNIFDFHCIEIHFNFFLLNRNSTESHGCRISMKSYWNNVTMQTKNVRNLQCGVPYLSSKISRNFNRILWTAINNQRFVGKICSLMIMIESWHAFQFVVECSFLV